MLQQKGSKIALSDYRPVSLTCIMGKGLESILGDELMNYFMQYNLFSARQFGFIKGIPTALRLLNIIDSWTFKPVAVLH